MHRVLLVLVAGAVCAAAADDAYADAMTFEFRTDGGSTNSICGDTLTVSRTALSIDGVTFDATLTVVGSDDLGQNSSGLGVDGTRVNAGESLTFSMAISNIVGGEVTFGGFTEVDFNFFTGDDKAELKEGSTIFLTLSTASNLVDISGTLPAVFVVGGLTGTGTTSFSIDDVSGSFTATSAVPEPGTLALLSLGLVGVVAARSRRRRPACSTVPLKTVPLNTVPRTASARVPTLDP